MVRILSEGCAADTWQPKLDWGDCDIHWSIEAADDAQFEASPCDGSATFVLGKGANLDHAEQRAHAQWQDALRCQEMQRQNALFSASHRRPAGP